VGGPAREILVFYPLLSEYQAGTQNLPTFFAGKAFAFSKNYFGEVVET
jgi:hypothetical protein